MNIQHEPDQSRFTASIDGTDDIALLTYRLIDAKTINFDYSFVPVAFRGKGIAKKLVDFGFEWARKENYQLKASCSYVALFL